MIVDFTHTLLCDTNLDNYVGSLCLVLCSSDMMKNISEISTVTLRRHVFDRSKSNLCAEVPFVPVRTKTTALRVKFIKPPSDLEKWGIINTLTGLIRGVNVKDIVRNIGEAKPLWAGAGTIVPMDGGLR